MTNIKRIGMGLLTSVVILLLLDLLPNLAPDQYAAYRIFDYFYVWPGVGGMIAMFVAAFGGAYVSKVRFVVPAVCLAVGVWMFTVYFLDSIAAAAGEGDFLFAASINLLGLVFGIAGAVIGAIIGARQANSFHPATE